MRREVNRDKTCSISSIRDAMSERDLIQVITHKNYLFILKIFINACSRESLGSDRVLYLYTRYKVPTDSSVGKTHKVYLLRKLSEYLHAMQPYPLPSHKESRETESEMDRINTP